jgi:hypothetical protein
MAEVSEAEPVHRARRSVFVTLLVLVIAAWAFALVYSVTRSEPEPLDDASRAALARACERAEGRLRALDDLGPGDTTEVAAVLVDEENAIYAEMLASMREVSPTDADGAAALRGWLDDWDELVAARALHADELRDGDTSGFDIPAERSGGSKPITVRMNEYAEMKGLEQCTPSMLRAEVTDRPRAWGPPDQ